LLLHREPLHEVKVDGAAVCALGHQFFETAQKRRRKMKATLISVWTLICLVGGGFLAWWLPGPTTYQGTQVTFQVTDRKNVTINAESVEMEAADGTFFVLRNGDVALVGLPTPKPLGWEEDYYFTAELDEAPGGEWAVEKGDWVTVKVTSDRPMSVEVAFIPWARAVLIGLIVLVTGFLWIAVAGAIVAGKG
jgi:hypothetical protein